MTFQLRPYSKITNSVSTIFATDVKNSDEVFDYEIRNLLYIKQGTLFVIGKDDNWYPITNVTGKGVVSYENFRAMLFDVDEVLEECGIDPLIYTCYYQHESECVIVLVNEHLQNAIISTEHEEFRKIPRDVANDLLQGRNNELFRIINEYETVAEALDSKEMWTYKDVLDTI